jgi:hypothetical protein
MWDENKHFTPISDWGDDIIVLTPITPLDIQKQSWLRRYCEIEKVKGYSLWYAAKSWLWKNPDDDKPTGDRYHCASFVSAMYRKIGIDLVPGRSDDTTQPQDFLESPLLRRLGG